MLVDELIFEFNTYRRSLKLNLYYLKFFLFPKTIEDYAQEQDTQRILSGLELDHINGSYLENVTLDSMVIMTAFTSNHTDEAK